MGPGLGWGGSLRSSFRLVFQQSDDIVFLDARRIKRELPFRGAIDDHHDHHAPNSRHRPRFKSEARFREVALTTTFDEICPAPCFISSVHGPTMPRGVTRYSPVSRDPLSGGSLESSWRPRPAMKWARASWASPPRWRPFPRAHADGPRACRHTHPHQRCDRFCRLPCRHAAGTAALLGAKLVRPRYDP
jgi:hypothetical protein